MILNETPVRTTRNFNINNITIENINMPKETSNQVTLKYGVGSEITNLKPTVVLNVKNDDELVFELNKQNPFLIDNINVFAENDINLTLKYISKEYIEYFHSSIIKLTAKENVNVNITIVNFLNNLSNNFFSIENEISNNANVNYTIIDFGGKNSITNYYSKLSGNESINNVNTIYLGTDNQLFDLNYIGHLYGEKSKINIEMQGALKDNSRKHFKGTIDFKKGAKKAIGNENEGCMLLSDTAKSLSLPMLLCSEEDVEGNHSCSAGKIGEKELFYIMSRGFDKKDAMKLMIKAKFNKILDNIKDNNLKQEIIDEIDRRIDK